MSSGEVSLFMDYVKCFISQQKEKKKTQTVRTQRQRDRMRGRNYIHLFHKCRLRCQLVQALKFPPRKW